MSADGRENGDTSFQIVFRSFRFNSDKIQI